MVVVFEAEILIEYVNSIIQIVIINLINILSKIKTDVNLYTLEDLKWNKFNKL
jgi:hypothetical protein